MTRSQQTPIERDVEFYFVSSAWRVGGKPQVGFATR